MTKTKKNIKKITIIMLRSPSRPLSPVEKMFIDCQVNTHLGMQFEDPSFIPTAVERCKERILGLYLRSDGHNVISTKAPITVNEIPRTCRDAGEATRWVIAHHMPKPHERLATLSAGKNTVVLSFNHMVADGTLLLQTIHNIAKDFKVKLPLLPVAAETTFADEIADLKRKPEEKFPEFSLYKPRYPEHSPHLKDDQTLRVIEYRTPVSELACLDKSKGIPHNLTEALLNSYLLSVCASNNEYDGKLSAYSCVNLRQYLPKSARQNPAICSHFSDVTVDAEAPIDAPVADLTKGFLSSLRRHVKEKQCLRYIGTISDPPKGGMAFELSNVGQVTWKPPVCGAYFHVATGVCGRPRTIDLFTHSMVCEPVNAIEMKIAYPQHLITREEADMLGKSVTFGLRHITDNMTIKEAIRALQDFQRTINFNK